MATRDTAFWDQVEVVFDAAVELDPAARQALLDAECAGRAELRAEVERLLAADALAAGFIESLPMPRLSNVPPASGPGVGSVVGAFRLIEAIGAGGMGTVYRAERADGAFDHRVAVKVLVTPMSHGESARRFHAERQILASLRHPHIVSLLDAGVTPDGHAYLAMEYVEGANIVAHCRARALQLPARLDLFRAVCSAVHHAHRHAVVHRDLKPANILVTADNAVKVVDFGIAKLLEGAAPAGATTTRYGAGPLTPNYASPEQLRGLPVTTSSDTYALGVLLYELVTGARPYETEGKPLDEVLRLVVEADPPRPSARPAPAGLPYPLRAAKGDIDAIVLKAMAKAPEQRYGSAEELAADVGRHLSGVPVSAREPSFAYVARRLAARHRVAATAIGVSLVLVMAALAIAIGQARIATAERVRAEQRFNEVRQLANSLIFEIHDQVAPLQGSTPVRQTIVARALTYLERLASEAEGDPTLQLELARAYVRIGRVQGQLGGANLGDREGALTSFRRAQSLLEPLALTPEAGPDVIEGFLEATRRVSETVRSAEAVDEAIREGRRALAIAEAYLQRHPGDIRARNFVASTSFTAALAAGSLPDWERAGALYEGLLAERPDDPQNQRNAGLVAKYLGDYYTRKDDLARALSYYERARTLDERRFAEHPNDRTAKVDFAIALSNVADAQMRLKNFTAAEPLLQRSLTIRQEVAESDPKDVFARSRVPYVHYKLAGVYEGLGDLLRALQHAERSTALWDSMLAETTTPSTSQAVHAFHYLAALQRRTGHPAACVTARRAFGLIAKLGEKTRAQMWHRDPIAEAAEQAATCGDDAARAWLASRAPAG